MKNKSALKFLGLCLNGLVDRGYKEDIDVIEEKMLNETLIPYLYKKYSEVVPLNEIADVKGVYYPEIEILSRYFLNWCGYIEGNEDRKFLVKNNGLALLSALIIEMLANNDF